MATAFTKAHTSALCLIPPRTAWEAVQNIRCFNDRNFIRWPPHINLIYPFVADRNDELQQAASKASLALESFGPFELTLDEVSFFEHRSSCTIWLGSKSRQLLDLQNALQQAFPDFDELSLDQQRNIRGFRPHLSLGQWNRNAVEQSLKEIQESYKPMTFSVTKVDVISRQGQTQPFKVRYKIPFGKRPEEVDVPYVASISQETPIHQPLSDEYGLGAVHDGVWYFAFGANMSSKKLEGKRRITPLESLPAKLPGWALEFNHRGAMGNIVKLKEGQKGSGGLQAAHGVLHRLSSNDFALLSGMEHEYRPTEVLVQPYSGSSKVVAVAFISPPNRLIQNGLPPTERYANLLRSGAAENGLDSDFCTWLNGMPTVPSEQKRGDKYWHDLDGQPMKMFPKIWKGSEPQGGRGHSGRGRGGRGGIRGRGGGRGSYARNTDSSDGRPQGRPSGQRGGSSARGGSRKS